MPYDPASLPPSPNFGYTNPIPCLDLTPAFSAEAIANRARHNGIVLIDGRLAYWSLFWSVTRHGGDEFWTLTPVIKRLSDRWPKSNTRHLQYSWIPGDPRI